MANGASLNSAEMSLSLSGTLQPPSSVHDPPLSDHNNTTTANTNTNTNTNTNSNTNADANKSNDLLLLKSKMSKIKHNTNTNLNTNANVNMPTQQKRPYKTVYRITHGENELFAVLHINDLIFTTGDDVNGRLEFHKPCVVRVTLQHMEVCGGSDNTGTSGQGKISSNSTVNEYCTDVCTYYECCWFVQQSQFSLKIPTNAFKSFQSDLVKSQWSLRFEFGVSASQFERVPKHRPSKPRSFVGRYRRSRQLRPKDKKKPLNSKHRHYNEEGDDNDNDNGNDNDDDGDNNDYNDHDHDKDDYDNDNGNQHNEDDHDEDDDDDEYNGDGNNDTKEQRYRRSHNNTNNDKDDGVEHEHKETNRGHGRDHESKQKHRHEDEQDGVWNVWDIATDSNVYIHSHMSTASNKKKKAIHSTSSTNLTNSKSSKKILHKYTLTIP
ncbi:hypothetical protein RFI_24448 [Reticulomyxa filosa]|uniref:Uncharacterized protein n=1 Tax=Reticulomyxa filosa TaxID=46433 RepID=X6MHP0_RETFI|nr:hypothetical protein RFI_24448 [Reticulomyxa filosa]|eukprot:ETO12927.1 hypothetical protein RFI_24448 [Reticulomyxa filosa]